MTKGLIKLVCVVGCWVCMIYAAAQWGLKAGAVVAMALIFDAIHAAVIMRENEEDKNEQSD